MRIVMNPEATLEEINEVCTKINDLGYLWMIQSKDPVEIEMIDPKGKEVELAPWCLRVLSLLYRLDFKQ